MRAPPLLAAQRARRMPQRAELRAHPGQPVLRAPLHRGGRVPVPKPPAHEDQVHVRPLLPGQLRQHHHHLQQGDDVAGMQHFWLARERWGVSSACPKAETSRARISSLAWILGLHRSSPCTQPPFQVNSSRFSFRSLLHVWISKYHSRVSPRSIFAANCGI